MRVNLPTDLLRSFVTIVDAGSMAKASEHVFLTQSALSLQMKRLTEAVQKPIFRRFQNSLLLTPAGEILLDYARKVLALNDEVVVKLGARLTGPARIGMVQDFADEILTHVLARFNRSNPDVALEIKIANSLELSEMLESDLLDIALFFGSPDDSSSIMEAELVWLGDPDLIVAPSLPVALMSKPCLFREAALRELEKFRRPYHIVIDTPSISVLRAAIESGLAITNRTEAFIGGRSSVLKLGTGDLPRISYNLSMAQSPHPAVSRLAELMRESIVKPRY